MWCAIFVNCGDLKLFWDAMNCITSSSLMRIISRRLLMFVKLTLKFWLRLNQFKVIVHKMRVLKVSSVSVLGMEVSSFFELSEQISDEIMSSLSSLEDWGKADGTQVNTSMMSLPMR
ncbi:MAG: hypothetical protein CM15mP49_00710 [Actinomycetota bacterium]|nr:MAG: hypothetical protein CM15mP49_00710 [Actinomycetota bacterium]